MSKYVICENYKICENKSTCGHAKPHEMAIYNISHLKFAHIKNCTEKGFYHPECCCSNLRKEKLKELENAVQTKRHEF